MNKSVLTNHNFTKPKIESTKEIYIDLHIGDLLLKSHFPHKKDQLEKSAEKNENYLRSLIMINQISLIIST